MIRFSIEPSQSGGYDLAPADEASRIFTDFVAFDLFGLRGVEEMLERAQAVLDGSGEPFEEMRNRYEISLEREETSLRDDEWGLAGRCRTTEFVAFLDSLLAEIGARADA